MKKYLPLMVNVYNKNVIIFGGGKVALRKAKKLLGLGAKGICRFKQIYERVQSD